MPHTSAYTQHCYQHCVTYRRCQPVLPISAFLLNKKIWWYTVTDKFRSMPAKKVMNPWSMQSIHISDLPRLSRATLHTY